VSERTERTVLALLLTIFMLLGITYSVLVPPFEASDEKWHYPLVKYIADTGSLPVQQPGAEQPWRQEGSQPPLYYALAAGVTCWIDTSDLDQVRYLNPHADEGPMPDGNVNLVVHRPSLESFPWRGTILAVHVIRLLSVLMGVASVYLAYRIAREVVPHSPHLALAAAAIHAFTPMYVFVTASVNNDALVIPLCSLALLMLLQLARSDEIRAWQGVVRLLLLGVVLGLAALTKTSALPLAVVAAVVITVRAARFRSWREFLVGALATAGPMLVVAGWWYARNLRLYGDLLGLKAFTDILGRRGVPADLLQLWRERFSFTAGYWGNFGGLNVPLPNWLYGVLNAAAVVAVAGMVYLLARRILRSGDRIPLWPWGLAICGLWGGGVLTSWAWWATVTWSSQGRLVFSALSVWSLGLAVGLGAWLPRKMGDWAPIAFGALLLLVSATAPFAWIAPTYALPDPLTEEQLASVADELEVDFGGVMRLMGYDLQPPSVSPGDSVEVTLHWEAVAPADRDYTVFVHLLGEHDLVIGQRDTYPGVGLLSTTWLEPGFRWADTYVVEVPDTAYTPDTAQMEVGLAHTPTGERLPATTPEGERLGDNVRFGHIEVVPLLGDVPNPVSVEFAGLILLEGYEVSERQVRGGDTATVTLYWSALRPVEDDYSVSAQFVDSAQRKAGQHDAWPQDGGAPTSSWEEGEVVVDEHVIDVYEDALPGVYYLRVAVYCLRDGEFVHLATVPEGGRMQSDHVVLTKVRVVE
jgi:4-amino-4-deoxy-L-arabinose transferase-like glycosyltransferase